MGRDAADSSTRLGSNVGPDWELRRLLQPHINNKECTELALFQACKSPHINCFGTVPHLSRRGPTHFVSQEYVRAWWCEDWRSDPGHVKAGLCWFEILDGQVHVQGSAQGREMHVHTRLCPLAKRRGITKRLLDQFRETAELNDEGHYSR